MPEKGTAEKANPGHRRVSFIKRKKDQVRLVLGGAVAEQSIVGIVEQDMVTHGGAHFGINEQMDEIPVRPCDVIHRKGDPAVLGCVGGKCFYKLQRVVGLQAVEPILHSIQRLFDLPVILIEILPQYPVGGFPLAKLIIFCIIQNKISFS